MTEEKLTDAVKARQQRLSSRIRDIDDNLSQLRSEFDQRLREAQRTHRRAIDTEVQRVKGHLAYLFGQQMVRAFRNPLRFVALPLLLFREWRIFRRRNRNIGSREPRTREVQLEPPAPSPSAAISLDLVRDLEVDALCALKEPQLLKLSRLATRAGEPHLAVRIAAARWLSTRSANAAHTFRLQRGQLLELNPKWLPNLARRPVTASDEASILHILKTVCPLEHSGGAVRSSSILTHQNNLGLKPVAILPLGSSPPRGNPAEPGQDGVFAREINGIETWFSRFGSLSKKSIPRDVLGSLEANIIAQICEGLKPSLIHAASGFRGYDNALKGLAVARSRRLPFVYEVRSFHEHTWSRMFEGILDAEMTKLRAIQEDRCMNAADAVVTISDAMAKEIVDRGVQPNKVFVVPNCVGDRFLEWNDTQATAEFRRRWQIEDCKVVGYISNISLREGHLVLCDAFCRLHATRRDTRLLIVGDGPALGDVKERVSALGIDDAVIFTGEIDHDEIFAAYKAIDVFAVPRLPDYAADHVAPMKPLEAMAMGRPLVMSDRPVSRELIGAQERGLSFQSGDAESLCEMLKEVLKRPEAAIARAENAREWVEQNRRWADKAAIYSDVYAAARQRHREES